MARRKMTKEEEQYVLDNYKEMSISDIVSNMKGVGEITVKKFLDNVDNNDSKVKDNTTKKKKKKSTTMDMMTGKHKGVVVMTPGASERNDDRYAKYSKESSRDNLRDRIYYMDEE